MIVGVGLCGAGSLAAIDRGNHIAFLVPLVYLYLCAIEEHKWKTARNLLVVISLLKFWGIIFIIPLVFNRRVRDVVITILQTLLISMISIAFFPGKFWAKVDSMIQMVTNKDYSNSIAGYSVSFFGLTRRTACYLSTRSWCNTKTFVGTFWTSTAALLILTVLVLVVFLVLQLTGSRGRRRLLLLSPLLGITCIPDAPRYNTVLLIVIVALVIRFAHLDAQAGKFSPESRLSSFTVLLGLSCFVSLIPITLRTEQVTRFSSGTGEGPTLARLDLWLVPFSFAVVLTYAFLDAIRLRFRQNSHDRDSERDREMSSNSHICSKNALED